MIQYQSIDRPDAPRILLGLPAGYLWHDLVSEARDDGRSVRKFLQQRFVRNPYQHTKCFDCGMPLSDDYWVFNIGETCEASCRKCGIDCIISEVVQYSGPMQAAAKKARSIGGDLLVFDLAMKGMYDWTKEEHPLHEAGVLLRSMIMGQLPL